jgi:hypothetical protein
MRDIKSAVLACVVLHNFIIDEKLQDEAQENENYRSRSGPGSCTDVDMVSLQVQSLNNLDIIFDTAAHGRLKSRLVNHIQRTNL